MPIRKEVYEQIYNKGRRDAMRDELLFLKDVTEKVNVYDMIFTFIIWFCIIFGGIEFLSLFLSW